MASVISMQDYRLQMAKQAPHAVYFEDGLVFVRVDGATVMRMDPVTARAWAKAIEDNAAWAEQQIANPGSNPVEDA